MLLLVKLCCRPLHVGSPFPYGNSVGSTIVVKPQCKIHREACSLLVATLMEL